HHALAAGGVGRVDLLLILEVALAVAGRQVLGLVADVEQLRPLRIHLHCAARRRGRSLWRRRRLRVQHGNEGTDEHDTWHHALARTHHHDSETSFTYLSRMEEYWRTRKFSACIAGDSNKIPVLASSWPHDIPLSLHTEPRSHGATEIRGEKMQRK